MNILLEALSSSNEWRNVYLVLLSAVVLLPVLIALLAVLEVSKIKPKAVYVPVAFIVGLMPAAVILGGQYAFDRFFWLFVVPAIILAAIVVGVWAAFRKKAK